MYMKTKKYIDIIYLLVMGYLISVGIFKHFYDNNILSLNFYIGVTVWLYVVYDLLFNRKGKFLVFYLLILGLFNVVVFSAYLFSFGSVYYIYKGDNLVIAFPGINPFFLLITLIYFVFNSKVLIDLYYRLMNGSDAEILLKMESGVKFYYEKFNSYSSESLKDVYKIYNEYPDEAQIALKKINKERYLNYLDF